jgi:hypothetical protein
MMTSQFIAMHSHEYLVVLMCSVLEVSGSGNDAWRKREPSRHSREDVFLAEKIVEAFQRSVSLRRRTPFTTLRRRTPDGERFSHVGKLAEGSDKLTPRIGFWAQDLDKKNFFRLGSLRERKFQGKKPKSFVHLLLEK